MYSHRIICELKGQETNVNLRHYQQERVSIYMARVVFGIAIAEADLHKVSFTIQDLAGSYFDLLERSVDLEPGSKIKIGRNRGLELFDDEYVSQEDSLKQLGGRSLHAAIKGAEGLSRDHAEIEVGRSAIIWVKDLGTTNGTTILGDPINPDQLRSQLRVVR